MHKKYEGAIKQDIEQIYIESKEVNNKDKEKLFDNFYKNTTTAILSLV